MQPTLKTPSIAAAARRMAGNPTSPLALRALALIDPERVSSATGIVGAFEQRASEISGDRNLSDTGKQSNLRAAADARLMGLSGTARQFVDAEKEFNQKRADAMRRAVPPAEDASTTLIDLALAAQVKADRPLTFALENGSARMRQALARVPTELSGVTLEQHARIVGSLIAPELAVVLGQEQAALTAARDVIQVALNELQGVAECAPAELVERFGSDWKLPGVAASTAQLLAAENDASRPQPSNPRTPLGVSKKRAHGAANGRERHYESN